LASADGIGLQSPLDVADCPGMLGRMRHRDGVRQWWGRTVATLVILAIIGCSRGDPPEAHPMVVQFELRDGLLVTPCADQAAWFGAVSTRDLARTAAAREEQGWRWSCAIPVDWRHERFLLYSAYCERVGEGRAEVWLSLGAADGALVYSPVRLGLDEATAPAMLSFGRGLPLMTDIEAAGHGDADCLLVGSYVRTTDSAELWGPVRLVPRTGISQPNDDRRGH
jgi:hypothetical protein